MFSVDFAFSILTVHYTSTSSLPALVLLI